MHIREYTDVNKAKSVERKKKDDLENNERLADNGDNYKHNRKYVGHARGAKTLAMVEASLWPLRLGIKAASGKQDDVGVVRFTSGLLMA